MHCMIHGAKTGINRNSYTRLESHWVLGHCRSGARALAAATYVGYSIWSMVWGIGRLQCRPERIHWKSTEAQSLLIVRIVPALVGIQWEQDGRDITLLLYHEIEGRACMRRGHRLYCRPSSLKPLAHL